MRPNHFIDQEKAAVTENRKSYTVYICVSRVHCNSYYSLSPFSDLFNIYVLHDIQVRKFQAPLSRFVPSCFTNNFHK